MSIKRYAAAGLVASALGLGGLALHEGYSARAYDDGVGVKTVGFGSTRGSDGAPVRAGAQTDPVRAVQRLAADADAAGRAVARCVGAVPLSQGEFDAFTSLTYNIGAGAFCASTLVRRLHQSPPDYAGACAELLRWTRAGGMELAGLKKRRAAEYAQCVGGGAP